jgi:hypothetical protein
LRQESCDSHNMQVLNTMILPDESHEIPNDAVGPKTQLFPLTFVGESNKNS